MRVARLSVVGSGRGKFAATFEGVGDDGYNPDGFYVRSTNEYNHTHETRVPMPPEVKGQIDDLIGSRMFEGTPIKSYQAFVRDAVVHNLQRLARLTGSVDVQQVATQQRMLAEIDQIAEDAKRLSGTVANAETYLTAAMRNNDEFQVRSMVAGYESLLPEMREPFASELGDIVEDARRWMVAREARSSR